MIIADDFGTPFAFGLVRSDEGGGVDFKMGFWGCMGVVGGRDVGNCRVVAQKDAAALIWVCRSRLRKENLNKVRFNLHRHSRESGNPAILQGNIEVSRIPAFARMTEVYVRPFDTLGGERSESG